MADENGYQLSEKEDWMNSKWRPMMGWMYMSICMFDFMIAPILWSLLQAKDHGMISSQWQPLTLQGAGLFHLAMGAVLGIAAHGRTQEKLNGVNNNSMEFPSNAGTTYVPPNQSINNNQFGINNGFGNNSNMPASFSPAPVAASNFGSGFGNASPTTNTATSTGFGSGFGNTSVATSPAATTTPIGGKPRPAPQQDPVL